VTPGYFAAAGAAVLRGRDFGPGDRTGSLPVALVNQSFEQRHLAGSGALGRRIRIGPDTSEWRTIVGVVPDLYESGVQNETPEAFYVPLAQFPARGLALMLRARGEPATLASAIREAIADVDPDLPIYEAASLDERISAENWYYGVFGTLFSAFGGAALFLASVGLYGVMAFSVSQRRREMGVRMAMGAQPRDVIRLVVRQGMAQTAVGLAVGTVFALGVSSLLSALLLDVSPRDPLIFSTIIVVLLGTAMLACWVPARRATRVDPLEALRSE
jgi:predicted permease